MLSAKIDFTNLIFLALATKASNQSYTSEVAITDLSLTFTIPAAASGRKLRLAISAAVINSSTATHTLRIRQTNISGTILKAKSIYTATATASEDASMFYVTDATPGSYTYIITCTVASGTGTFSAGAQFTAELL